MQARATWKEKNKNLPLKKSQENSAALLIRPNWTSRFFFASCSCHSTSKREKNSALPNLKHSSLFFLDNWILTWNFNEETKKTKYADVWSICFGVEKFNWKKQKKKKTINGVRVYWLDQYQLIVTHPHGIRQSERRGWTFLEFCFLVPGNANTTTVAYNIWTALLVGHKDIRDTQQLEISRALERVKDTNILRDAVMSN